MAGMPFARTVRLGVGFPLFAFSVYLTVLYSNGFWIQIAGRQYVAVAGCILGSTALACIFSFRSFSMNSVKTRRGSYELFRLCMWLSFFFTLLIIYMTRNSKKLELLYWMSHFLSTYQNTFYVSTFLRTYTSASEQDYFVHQRTHQVYDAAILLLFITTVLYQIFIRNVKRPTNETNNTQEHEAMPLLGNTDENPVDVKAEPTTEPKTPASEGSMFAYENSYTDTEKEDQAREVEKSTKRDGSSMLDDIASSPNRSEVRSGIWQDSTDENGPERIANPNSGIWDDSVIEGRARRQDKEGADTKSSGMWAEEPNSREKKKQNSGIWAEESSHRDAKPNAASGIWNDSESNGRKKGKTSGEKWAAADARPKTARRQKKEEKPNDQDIWAEEPSGQASKGKSNIWADDDSQQSAKKPREKKSSIWADEDSQPAAKKQQRKNSSVWADEDSQDNSKKPHRKSSGIWADEDSQQSAKKPQRRNSSVWADEDSQQTPKKPHRKSSGIWADEDSQQSAKKQQRRNSSVWADDDSQQSAKKQQRRNSSVWADDDSQQTPKKPHRKSSGIWADEDSQQSAKKPHRKNSSVWADEDSQENSKKPRRKSSSVWADEDSQENAKKPQGKNSSIWADDDSPVKRNPREQGRKKPNDYVWADDDEPKRKTRSPPRFTAKPVAKNQTIDDLFGGSQSQNADSLLQLLDEDL